MSGRSLTLSLNPIFGTLSTVCAVAIGLLGIGAPAQAQVTSPVAGPSSDFSFGMVGLVRGETARLNVVNIGAATGYHIPCVLLLAFVDSQGKVLKQTFVSLQSGKAALLDLTVNDEMLEAHRDGDNDDAPQRIAIRGIGYNPLLGPAAIPVPLSCNLLPTLELFDTRSGRTRVILEHFVKPGTVFPSPLVTQP